MTKLKIAQENDQRLYKDDSVYVHVKGVVRPFEFFLASIARTIFFGYYQRHTVTHRFSIESPAS